MNFGDLANGLFMGGNAFEAGRQQAKPRYYTQSRWAGNGLANSGLQEIDMNKGLANPYDMMNYAYGTAIRDKDGKLIDIDLKEKFNNMADSGMSLGDLAGTMFGNMGRFGNRLLGSAPIQNFILRNNGTQGIRGNFDNINDGIA